MTITVSVVTAQTLFAPYTFIPAKCSPEVKQFLEVCIASKSIDNVLQQDQGEI